MSFSPGPWRLSDDGRDIHDSTGRYIAYLSDLESDADARLIAAAREMYDLLCAGPPSGAEEAAEWIKRRDDLFARILRMGPP